MANELLSSLLREYSQKKLKAELELEDRKEKLYGLIPRLKEIDDELIKTIREETMARRKTKKVKLSPKATLLLTVLVVLYTLARPYLVPSVSIDEVPEYDGIP